MKKIFIFLFLFFAALQPATAQLANWTAYKSTKFATNLSGQIHGQARINQLKFHHSNPNKFYAITPQGGLFISNDAGTNWAVAPGTDILTYRFGSICIDYTDDQVLYLGSGDPNYWSNGAGVFKSTNGGNTFAQLNTGLPTNLIVAEILMHPTDHNTIVAATNGGIYKTTDAGATWTAKTATSLQFCSMQRNTAANSHILYATTRTAAPEFYRSTDFGETWTLITSGISAPVVLPLQSGSRVAVTSADANVVYFAMVASGGIVYKSTDGGLNFVQTKAGGSPYLTFYADDINDSGQGDYNFCIGVDNVDANKIWLQSHNTWYSNNSGSTWSMLTHWASKVHTDMHQVGQSPYNSNHLYSCNDGGVWLSTDGGNNWTPKNDGLFAYEITDHSGKGSPTRKDFITIGTQDNGRLYADSTGWYTIGGGDDYTKRELDKRANSTAVYFIGDPAGFSVSGVGERRIAPTGGNTSYNLPGGVTIVEALAFNRTNNNLAFLGSSNIYRSNDVLNNTPTWTQISNFSTPIMHVHSCIANPNRLYVVTNDQKIYVSNDALSANPTFAMYNLPAASNNTATVTAISNNADIVYIAINNRVYRSADGGQNWANITYNLPSANHRRILAEEYDGTEELVLVATSNAVYYKKAGQVTWTNYSTNLPSRKSPTDFSMYDDGSNQAVIRYASYGRSIWETPFHNIRATRAVVAAATTNACSDATWKFADASTGDIASRVWSFTSGTPSNSTDAHPTVTYAATGTYNVTLTVTDALGNTASTMYQAIVNDLNKCDADTIPGNALSQSATTDYLLMNAPLNISTNTITFSAWVKPNGMQSSTTGLIMSGSNGATGIHLRNSNRLSYHWNNESGSYNFSGPTIPSDVWSHIAVVVTPSSATFYLNGVPTVRNASHVAVNFNSAFYIGNDRGNISRTFKGLMDEVCIYNRSLTTNEIREMMHLTKNPTADPNLLAYYQMNEPSGNLILNHAQTIHATLQGNATRNTSTAPVGGGLSERQGVASSGAKNFSTVGVILAFPNTGTLPNGDVVVTRLNVPPDQKPTPTIVPQNGYYIINNFGTNSTFETLTSIQFDNLPNIGSGYSTGQFGFYKRSSVADGNTWGSVADRADTFVPNGQNSSLTFSTGNNINNFSQFALTPTYATAGNDAWLCSGESVGIGDVPMSGLTYSWSPAAGLSATNISNPTASPTTTTTYTLTVTETASGMTFTDDVVVSIHSVPLLSAASITPTPASATVCGGGSVLMTASGGSAPAFVELGNGASVTTGNSVGSELGPNPLQNYYGGSKQQMLFTAAELHALGITTGAQLSGFGVNLSTAGTSYALNDLKISIQHTSLATLSTFVMSGWTTVRNAANYTPTAGWNTIPFNTNFTWDGLSNLLIEITYSNNNGGSGGTRNTAFFGTTNFVSTLFYRNDSQTSATIEAYSGAPSYSYSLRNNVRFALSGTTNYTWSPIAGLNAATGSNVTATPSTTTTYTVSATFSGACPATASQVVTVNANPSLSLAASCSGGPGTGVLTPTFVAGSGGTASYNPSTLTGLSNGNYTVTVTESPSGCTATASATINCTVQCPDLSAAAPAATVGSQSTCSNCALSGGTLAAPSGTCPTGSTLQYSTDGGTNWTTTLPTYDQTTAMTILTRCNCNSDTNQSSPTSSVTTVPGVCTPVTATISGTATACDMVQLTASGGASYAWSGGASPSTAINTFSTSGTYTVTVTGSNGCTATASQVVTVNANPSLSLAASCSGGPGTGVLTPTFVAGSGGTASYNPSTLTGLSDGNYTVTVTESPSGCTATASATINCTVQCPDLSAAAPAATVGSQSTCSNCALSGGTLAAPSGTCPTGSTLQYSTDGGTSWSTTLPTYDQTTAMTILTRCNCNSDTNQSSPTSSVTTVPGVCTPVTATISGTATACDMVQLTASGGASYAWSGGASPSTAINTFSTSGTYTVTVTGSNGCTASASQVVTVNANPTVNITGPNSVCEGNTLTLTASGGTSYSWGGPGGFAAATATMSRTGMTAAMAGTYTVTVTNVSGCTTSASRTVAVDALPAATAGSNSPVCTGATINLTASGGVTYAWTGPGFSSSLQNPSRGSATLAMAGTYTVTVTNASGCTATASTTVAVNSCGAVLNVVSYSIGKENGTSNGSITLNVAGGTPCTGNTYNYAWSGPSSGSATGGSSFVISPLATGWYIITITDCAGNSKVVSYFVPLATRGRTKSEGIPFDGLTAYPNPTSDLSTIKFTSWSNERMYLAVYSMDGREVAVLFDGIAEEEADYELPLSVSDLAAGIYNVLLISQSGQREMLRLAISK